MSRFYVSKYLDTFREENGKQADLQVSHFPFSCYIIVSYETKSSKNGTKSGKTLKFPQSLCYKNRYSIV